MAWAWDTAGRYITPTGATTGTTATTDTTDTTIMADATTTELTAEQWKEKCLVLYKAISFYEKRAHDLFNGKREEAEAEMAGILAKHKQLLPLRKGGRDYAYTRAPDGNLYLVDVN